MPPRAGLPIGRADVAVMRSVINRWQSPIWGRAQHDIAAAICRPAVLGALLPYVHKQHGLHNCRHMFIEQPHGSVDSWATKVISGF